MIPDLAIASNAALYASIFRAHRLASRLDEHYWSTDADPPPYYSRLVTRTRGSTAQCAQLSRLEELARFARGRSWACKDSFAELPDNAMTSLGLAVLFRAWWYGCAGGTVALQPETDLLVQRVTTSAALLAWEDGWRQSSPTGGTRVFPDTVLEDADLELCSMSHEGRLAGGFMLNRSDAAVGLSNVFQVESSMFERGTFLRECARSARYLHADRVAVGFGSGSEVEALTALGFVPLGPLAVWASTAVR